MRRWSIHKCKSDVFKSNWDRFRFCFDEIAFYNIQLTHWPLGDIAMVFKVKFQNLLYRIVACAIVMKLVSGEPLDLADHKSTLIRVMAWCRQASSHYLNQCWPRFTTPNGITEPQAWHFQIPKEIHIFMKSFWFMTTKHIKWFELKNIVVPVSMTIS